MAEGLVLRGTMCGHNDKVTAIATPIDNSDMIVSSSRDKSIIVWHLTKEDNTYGVPRRRLTGHSHFVQDVVLSMDGQFTLSASWDGELRLWNLADGTVVGRFVGHTKEVLSVALSNDNRTIVSASRDHTIKLWNVIGDCKHTISDGHNDWVSCMRFSPKNLNHPTFVSASWDSTVKVWNLTDCKLRNMLAGHNRCVNTVAIPPDGSLCASGGKDGVVLVWDLEKGEKLYSLDAGVAIIHALCFSPSRYWLCAATEQSIRIWELESKSIVEDLKVEDLKTEGGNTNEEKVIYCTSLNWSADGSTLFSGYTDGVIRVWEFDLTSKASK